MTPINAISHHAIIEPSARIGKGVVISAGCIISHGVCIGNNTYISTGVNIGINTQIGENCYLAPGCLLGGECNIKRSVSFNMRSALKSYLTVGKNQEIEVGDIIQESLPDLALERFER